MVFSFVLAILYEGLKTFKDLVAMRSQKYYLPSRHNTLSESEADLHQFIPHRYVCMTKGVFLVSLPLMQWRTVVLK